MSLYSPGPAEGIFLVMKGRGGAWAQFVLWLAFLVASILGLHKLGSAFPVSAIGDAAGPFEPALAAAFRVAGLAVAYWLAASTLAYLVAMLSRAPAALRAVGWMTIGPVRRLVDRLAAGALAVSLAMPAGASTSPGYVPVPAGDSPQASTTTTQPAVPVVAIPDLLYLPVVPLADPDPLPVVRVVDTPVLQAVEIVVRPGDNMWRLAEQRLAELLGRPPVDSEIAPFWLQVIAANVGRIRSGDPDLIFPGEVLVIPAPK